MKRNEMIKRCMEQNMPVMVVGGKVEELKEFAFGNTAVLEYKVGYSFEDNKSYIAKLNTENDVMLLNKYDLANLFDRLVEVDTLIIENVEDFVRYPAFIYKLATNMNYHESKERHYLFTTQNEHLINSAVYNRIGYVVRDTIQENEPLELAE